ncbi:hypothetical protein NM688_g6069 [Phlebia brevispora]|uniref:Uncharacterized protein n=1 Tax=Phlebia brevispora TaxID=194682 RepID=A0ACC1SK78_9APHY|nr:hypothetical protein NM688_g6069 [Phlebia brevispora]
MPILEALSSQLQLIQRLSACACPLVPAHLQAEAQNILSAVTRAAASNYFPASASPALVGRTQWHRTTLPAITGYQSRATHLIHVQNTQRSTDASVYTPPMLPVEQSVPPSGAVPVGYNPMSHSALSSAYSPPSVPTYYLVGSRLANERINALLRESPPYTAPSAYNTPVVPIQRSAASLPVNPTAVILRHVSESTSIDPIHAPPTLPDKCTEKFRAVNGRTTITQNIPPPRPIRPIPDPPHCMSAVEFLQDICGVPK